MLRTTRRRLSRWSALLGAAGSLALLATLSACPGSLDPSLLEGEGGSPGSGGTGGGTGGTGGGTSDNCTGGNDGATLITNNCATGSCHDTADANKTGAGLDLTIDSTIANRLVGIDSPGDSAAGSACGGEQEPYLNTNSNPATGLLIDKITLSVPPCGLQMPYIAAPLSGTKQQCIIEWATTLTTAGQ
jgi:hypothetical protein